MSRAMPGTLPASADAPESSDNPQPPHSSAAKPPQAPLAVFVEHVEAGDGHAEDRKFRYVSFDFVGFGGSVRDST